MVKRVLKIIGIIMLVVILLLVVLFVIAALKPAVPEDYTDTVKTGGDIEKKYLKNGTYSVAYTEVRVDEDFEKYEIYYPENLSTGNRKYPVIVVSNGTGMKWNLSLRMRIVPIANPIPSTILLLRNILMSDRRSV